MGAQVNETAIPADYGHAADHAALPVVEEVGRNATKTLSSMRVLFGAIFLFDGILKWVLFSQGTMQATVQSFGFDFLSNNWVAVGTLVALGETFGGLALIFGIFQRPAALWSAVIMFSIWGLSGFDGAYVSGTGWNFSGYTDPGGDLMLALVYVVLVFAPYAYGLASRYHLRDKFPTSSVKDKVLRFLVC